MVAINFPDSPTNGQEHSGYVWDATNNVWNRLPTLPALDLVAFSATAPSSPQDGQFWFDTTSSKMYVYYNDGSSSQWVSTIGGFNELNAIDDVVISSATAGQALTYDGTNWVNGGAGKILQVVSTTKTDVFSTTSPTPVDITGASASITPSSTSSKVFVTFSTTVFSSTGDGKGFILLRDSTNIGGGTAVGSRLSTIAVAGMPNGVNDRHVVMGSFLDSPNTTSAVTYKLQTFGDIDGRVTYIGRSHADSDNAQPSSSRTPLTITLMEVAG